MARDLRSFLTQYEASHPELVLRLRKEIRANQEVTALVMKLEKEEKYPVVIAENILTCSGNKSSFPLITNLLASRSRCAEAIGSTFRTVHLDFYKMSRQSPLQPQVLSRAEAPVKQVVKVGRDVDLTQSPALYHHYMDPGPYFTAGFLTTYDPDSGIDNCALQRGWIYDKRTVRFYPYTVSHNWLNLRKNRDRGQPTRLAYWVGHHPATCVAAQSRLGYPQSHFAAMGGVLGEALRVVPSETLGDDFLVPADAEVVVEGVVKSYDQYPEGPFGEYGGYIGPQVPNPQFEVTAITHRKDAYWHDILVGHPDNQVMGGFAMEAAVYETVKQRIPSLVNVYIPLSGTCRFHAYLQLENPWRGDAREAIMSALTVDFRLKHAFVFDTDIDIFDERQVLFAIATRSQWDRDVMIFPNVKNSIIDPSATYDTGAKGGIDCTKPVGEAFSELNTVDMEIMDSIQISDYVSPEQYSKMPTERM